MKKIKGTYYPDTRIVVIQGQNWTLTVRGVSRRSIQNRIKWFGMKCLAEKESGAYRLDIRRVWKWT